MADFDEARFVEEVLKPVQDGWRPTDNLFRVYRLPVTVSDPRTIADALERVARQLGSPRFERGFPAAVAQLRSGHAAAGQTLTTPALRQQHAAAVQRLAQQLQAALADRVAGGPGLPMSLVNAIVADSRGSHTRNEVRQALGELNASAQDPVDLPSPAAPKAWPQLGGLLNQIGSASLYDYLATTPGLSAAATTEPQLDGRVRELRLRKDAAKTAEANLIETLRQIVRAKALTDTLRYELLAELEREATSYRFPVLLDKTKETGPRLKALGIQAPASASAVAYAVWCRERYPESSGSRTGWKLELREALGARDLRRAIDALRSAEKLTPDEQKELAGLTARVSALEADIARARDLEQEHPEEAAQTYLTVRAQLADPAVEAGLVRCRPAPARGVTARLDGTRAAVAWQPSPSTAGRLGYTVVRALDRPPIGVADGHPVATDTADLSVADTDPPAARELFYAVFAVREGAAVGDPVVSAPLVVLPEVGDLEVVPAADAIRARWRTPEAAAGVEVDRRESGQGGAWSPVRDVRRQDFTDVDIVPGTTYEYRVRVRYRLAGDRTSTSAGRTVAGRGQQVPTAVDHLDVTPDGDDVVISWPVPSRGEVEVRRLVGGRLPEGGVVPVASLDGVAPPLGDVVLRSRSELRTRPRPGAGSLTLVAVTVLGELAAIGPTRVLDRRIRPVTELRAVPQGRAVQLSWVWPEDVIEARVLHRVGAEPTGPDDPDAEWHLVSRTAYDASGARFDLHPGENVFAVATTAASDQGRIFGPLVAVTVASVAEVRYRIIRTRGFGARGFGSRRFGGRRRLTVGAAGGPPLPPMQLVARPRIRPLERTQGRVLLDLPGAAPEHTEEFDVPRDLGRPLHLRLFSLDPGVVLRAEQPDQLVIP